MSKYIATVRYDIEQLSVEVEYSARAKGIQYVKEQYHRYTHENYADVSRESEDEHTHPISDESFQHTLVDITPVDEVDLFDKEPLRLV